MTPPNMSQILAQAAKDRKERIRLEEALKALDMMLYCKDKEILLLRNRYLYGPNRAKIIEIDVQ